MEEIWEAIPNYEETYQASSLGRVRSINRTINLSRGSRFYKGKVLKLVVGTDGYLKVNLSINGKRMSKGVHQLVAMAFLGHTPNGFEKVVDHIDGNILNNKLENLRIVSSRINSSKRNPTKKRFSNTVGAYESPNGKYYSTIYVAGSSVRLGTYTTEKAAGDAYTKARIKFENNEKYYQDNIAHLSNKSQKNYLLS